MQSEATLPPRILVVDDEVPVRRMMERTLAEHGFMVLSADCAEQAMWKLGEGRVDVLVTEVVMRGMNGRELALRLYDVAPESKVLFVSGFTRQQNGLQCGCNYLQKPFAPCELVERVRGLLLA